ncbi:mannitol dehydrogenase family protein, partial [Bosea sp. (in: a-proteobacteria)]
MSPIALNRRNLAVLPPSVERPRFDPAQVNAGIAHIGLGGFHRAHMARYTQELMEQEPRALDWGILGCLLMPNDRRMKDCLAPQDGLYTLVEREGAQERVRVIASLAGLVDATQSSEALLAKLDDPAVRIISLTVTENGYCLNPATKQLDPNHVLIRADLESPGNPRSAIGLIVETLRRRKHA